ncbi:MAG: radical SAM protein, partial [Chloroflexota bacterium]
MQTARGCPFECEFCDVIQYAGRKQRHKSVEQILAELDVLYQQGYSGVFIADDNFTVYRRRTKALLLALREWNNRQPDGRLRFSTQLSIDIASEDEILQLCAEAGIEYVF